MLFRILFETLIPDNQIYCLSDSQEASILMQDSFLVDTYHCSGSYASNMVFEIRNISGSKSTILATLVPQTDLVTRLRADL